MMLGVPTEIPDVLVVCGEQKAVELKQGDFLKRKTAAPAPTPTAIAPPIHSHLCPPCDAVKTPSPPDLGATESLKYCVLMRPARACSLIAVTRISTGPGVLFHCIPHTDARPSGPVVTISVRRPELKVPLAPSSGRRKLTAAMSTGLPVSSVTSTVRPRVARVPVRDTVPSPSTTFNCTITEASAQIANARVQDRIARPAFIARNCTSYTCRRRRDILREAGQELNVERQPDLLRTAHEGIGAAKTMPLAI